MSRWSKQGGRCAFAVVVASSGLWLARAAFGAESWPPPTPPRVELPSSDQPPTDQSPTDQAPTEQPPTEPVVPLAPPVAPAPPPPVDPPAPSPIEAIPERPPPSGAANDSRDAPTLVSAPTTAPSRRVLPFGSKDGQLFLRTPGDELVLLPTVRLEIGGQSLAVKGATVPEPTASLGLARLDFAGWIVSKIYFDFSADFASGPSLRHVDNFVAVAPWDDRVIFQLGQFDAPFTLENRTSERYLDFIGRGAAIRGFAIPENKDQGLMVHGTNRARNYYYAAALLTGKGPELSSLDDQLDVMARAWVAPFSFAGPPALAGITLGASGWTGDRVMGSTFHGLATQAGFPVIDGSAWWTTGPPSQLVVRERGRLYAGALELNAPIARRFGARFEWIAKRETLSAIDASAPGRPIAGGLELSGSAAYAEVWGWLVGNDRMLGSPASPGLALPARLRELADSPARLGIMLAARIDHVDEQIALTPYSKTVGLGAGSLGTTRLTALTFGVTGWYTRRTRLDVNYVFNQFDGTTPYLLGLGSKSEQEVLLRSTFAL